MTVLTKNERACLEGALRLSEVEEVLGPRSQAGSKACRSLAEKGLLRFVGWFGQTIGSQPVYEITSEGRALLLGISQ